MSEIVSNVQTNAQPDVQDGFKAFVDPHIIDGRTLKQDDIPVAVLELIQEQGWSLYLQLQAPVYPELVHQFYSSLKYHPQDPSITAIVVGKTFGFNTQNLSEWFHLGRQGVSTYCKKGWITDSRDFNSDSCLRVLNNIALDHVFEDPHYFLRRPNVQDLPANRFILLKILKDNVIPVLNKDNQVGVYECTLLYWLLTHKKINLPSTILKHMHECSNRLNKPCGMLLTHIFAKREIHEVRPSRVRYLDAECLGYCGLVKIGEEYYMKKEFRNLDEATRAEYGPRRSMSSLPSTSRAPQAEAEENANTEVPVRAPRVKRSKLASHASSASLMHRHSCWNTGLRLCRTKPCSFYDSDVGFPTALSNLSQRYCALAESFWTAMLTQKQRCQAKLPSSKADLNSDVLDKSRAATSGKSKSKSRAPTTSTEERLYYGDGSYLWFDSEEERTRFLTFFSKRVVAPPRIIPEHYPELQGYDDLDAQLGRIAGLPYQGDDVSLYGGEDWVLNNEGLILNELGITELILHALGRPTIHFANPEGRLLLYIVSRIIKPRKHGHTIMSGEDLKLIHAIMHSAPINWAKFVMINMTIAASTDHNHLLPYPFVVMDILERFKVTTTVGRLTKATKIWAISTQTFKKRSDNAGPATGVQRPRSAAGPAEPQARANLASIADSLNRLHFKVDGMDGYLERLDEAVQRQGYAMNAYFQRVNYVPPPYHGTFFGQVYGDEDEDDASYDPSSSPDEDEFDDAVDGDEMDVEDDEEETEDED
ncbi:unnamed protein product [Cuscuta campestris]|uniref:Putative plant transposon protein domain-containing protein n=1 Tax=Cuscuta campestris TaxID=132261 RepID=A0A484LII4_9ASTE|nr:unnamed protein product [Cuscuta campestris]